MAMAKYSEVVLPKKLKWPQFLLVRAELQFRLTTQTTFVKRSYFG